MNESSTKSRMGVMDAWRVVLPLLGVVYHGLGGETGWGRHQEFIPIMSAIDSFRMEAFFAMAGLLAGVRLSRPGYLPNRLRSTLVPVITLWLLATVVKPEKMFVLLSESTLHMWFLICLAEISIIAVLVERFSAFDFVEHQRGWIPFLLLAVPFSLAAQFSFPYMCPDGCFSVAQSPLKLIKYIPYFAFGIFLSRNRSLAASIGKHPALWLIGPAALVALAAGGVFVGAPIPLLQPGLLLEVLRLLCAAGLTLLVIGSSVAISLQVGAKVKWLANASFTLYVLHLPLLKLSGKIFGGLDLVARLSLGMLIATLGSLAMYWLMTRSPILKTAFNGARLTTYSQRPVLRWLWQGSTDHEVAHTARSAWLRFR